jgi:hypothetical protein
MPIANSAARSANRRRDASHQKRIMPAPAMTGR